MNRRLSSSWSWIAALCALVWIAEAVPAQQAPASSAPARQNPAAVARTLLPPLPQGKSPIDFFRDLLSMSAADRGRILSKWPADRREVLEAKIQEYENLAPEERELRLRVTELRHYLLPLMSVTVTNRGPMLQAVPADLRLMVEERLRRWDQLSPDKQKELLDNESWLRQVTEFSSGSPAQRELTLGKMSGPQRQAFEAAVRRWEDLGADQRREVTERFEAYFELRPQERARTLRTLPEMERLQMQKTLQSFNKLDPVRRASCVRALDKLAKLTPEERDEFLKNAERWQKLSPEERASWRRLVFNLSMPPAPRPPYPPLPPPQASGQFPVGIATNR